jgi:hypothetical protein
VRCIVIRFGLWKYASRVGKRVRNYFFLDPGARPVFNIPPVLHKGEQNTNIIRA